MFATAFDILADAGDSVTGGGENTNRQNGEGKQSLKTEFHGTGFHCCYLKD